MNEDFVTFEIAKRLKEKGFRMPCIAHYTYLDRNVLKFNIGIGCIRGSNVKCMNDASDIYTDAPTISQVLKWLREEKKIYVEPCILADADTDADDKVINEYIYWSFSITDIQTGNMIYFEYEHIDDKRFEFYEQAALAGIKYVLDNLI